MQNKAAGYEEVEHTADWALRVWAPDLEGIFAQAAQGMYALMETTLAPDPHRDMTVELQAPDSESLLVAFLSELLYYGEAEGLGFEDCRVILVDQSLRATLRGARITSQVKEIKAVTFHNLKIEPHDGMFWATIVFDV